MIESPSSSKERTELHLGLYAGLAGLWPAPANTDIPVIHLPGAASSTSDQVITT